jgi:hypothetical protein
VPLRVGIAGRVLVRRDGGARTSHELVKIDRPVMRIPSLAGLALLGCYQVILQSGQNAE